jgi:hypothetical protein
MDMFGQKVVMRLKRNNNNNDNNNNNNNSNNNNNNNQTTSFSVPHLHFVRAGSLAPPNLT